MATDVRDTPAADVEVVEELTDEELKERHLLELKVERAFHEAGKALRELRDRRLYRNSHKTFEEYCRDRFGFSRQNANYFIAGAGVVDNLLNLTKNLCQTLPTKFEQVRHLTTLDPDDQCQIWQEAVEEAGGRVPSGRIVKGIVERLKEQDATLPPIPFQERDVVLIRGLGNSELRKYDGRWAIALSINEYTVTLAVDGKDVAVKPLFLEEVDPKYWAEIKAVNERITRLQFECELDPAEDAVLEVLRRRTCFTLKQMMLLERMEQDYAKA